MFQHLTHFDYRKPSDEIFVDLVFYTNGIRLSLDQIQIEEPEAFYLESTVSQTEMTRNTRIVIKGSGEGYRRMRGERMLFYNRIELDHLEEPFYPIWLKEHSIQSVDLLPTINALYGLSLVSQDIVNEVFRYEEDPFILKANAKSLVWLGQMKLNLILKPPLVTQRKLFGFYNPYTRLTPVDRLSGFTPTLKTLLSNRNLNGF